MYLFEISVTQRDGDQDLYPLVYFPDGYISWGRARDKVRFIEPGAFCGSPHHCHIHRILGKKERELLNPLVHSPMVSMIKSSWG